MKFTSALLNRPGTKSRDHRAFLFAVVLPLASVLFMGPAGNGLQAFSSTVTSEGTQARQQNILALQERQRRFLEFLLEEWSLEDPPSAEAHAYERGPRAKFPTYAVVFSCPKPPVALLLSRSGWQAVPPTAYHSLLRINPLTRRGPPALLPC
jgi:hypothetical protein